MGACCTEKKIDQQTINKDSDYLSNVRLLRDEATSLKECFNNQCFQAIAIISTYYVFLFKFIMKDGNNINWDLMLSAYAVLVIIISVLNVGIYKFESANRLIGYILHVERKNYKNHKKIEIDDKWNESSSFIVNWESMVKAWRIFQTIVENEMYVKWTKNDTSKFVQSLKIEHLGLLIGLVFKYFYCQIFKGKLKKQYKDKSKYLWYLPGELVHSKGDYNPGNYLKRMMYMLHTLGLIAYILITIGTFKGELIANHRLYFEIIWFVTTIALSVLMFYRPMILSKRIEQELFCIHSTSIFWSVISKAHDRALIITSNTTPFKHYSFILSCLALQYVDFGINRALEWCDDDANKKISSFIKSNLLDDYPTYLRVEIEKGLDDFCLQ